MGSGFAALRTVFPQDKALTTLDGKPLFVLTADLGQQVRTSAKLTDWNVVRADDDTRSDTTRSQERVDVVVIGAGQARQSKRRVEMTAPMSPQQAATFPVAAQRQ
jgi:hypothetical protein